MLYYCYSRAREYSRDSLGLRDGSEMIVTDVCVKGTIRKKKQLKIQMINRSLKNKKSNCNKKGDVFQFVQLYVYFGLFFTYVGNSIFSIIFFHLTAHLTKYNTTKKQEKNP